MLSKQRRYSLILSFPLFITFIGVLWSQTNPRPANSSPAQGTNGAGRTQVTPQNESEYQRGFEEGLKQHSEILTETRAELAEMRAEFQSARTTSRIFTIFYSLLAAFFVGTGAY